METTETMDTIDTMIPTNYTVSPRPTYSRGIRRVPPRLLADLDHTLKGGDALAFPITGLDDKAVNRMAARLNGVGRKQGVGFSVRTRRVDDALYAWAVPKQPVRTRSRRNAPAASAPEL